MMGLVLGFILEARLEGRKLTWMREGPPELSDILILVGCAVVVGLISAIKGDDFWSRLLGR